jgi:ATP-binding cassette subfamily F protein 3
MISISNLRKTYAERDLFANLSLSINRGEKIGLVGPNGSGKTTFFSIILGNQEPSEGTVQIQKNIRIGHLPQEASFDSMGTVLEEVTHGDEALLSLLKEKNALEAQGKAASGRYGEILHELEFLGYFNLEHKAKKILMGLGFKEQDFSRHLRSLSGGWQMRVLLAKLLTLPYDVLLLDEPMNHLDLGAALWFKDYLLGFKGTFVMISHDKDFLNEVTNYTLVLEEGVFTKIKGNYDDYDRQRRQKRELLLRRYNEQQKKRQQLLDFISRFHAQPNKASQVRAKKKQLEMMPEIVVPGDRRESIRGFRFPPTRRGGHKVMSLVKAYKSYGEIKVYQNFDFEIFRGEKAVLVGENGAGKSTLLKILAGVAELDEGQRIPGHNIEVGYFSQRRLDVLDAQRTVYQEAYAASKEKLTPEAIRTILAAFFFVGEDIEKKVSVLSGGEKSRLILAKLLLNPPNFLLLDEPTTHLDVDAVDALIKALSEYEGTLVFISHDIHFVRSLANTVFEVKKGKVRKFPGNFDYYWRKIKSDGSGQVFSKTGELKKERPTAAPGPKSAKDYRQEQKRIKAHNAKIARRIKELRKKEQELRVEQGVKSRILSNPRSYHNKEMVIEYGRKLKETEELLAKINREIQKLKSSFL